MEKLQSHRIARIILKMRYNIATDKEKREIEVWVKMEKGRTELFNKIVSGESLKGHLDLTSDYDRSADYVKLQAEILHTLNKRNKQRRLKRYSLWCGSVAAVLLVVCMIVFKYIGGQREVVKEKVEIVKAMPPVTTQDKVILVLANGYKVGVKGIRQDSLRLKTAVVMGQKDKLVYESRLEKEEDIVEKEPEINRIITTTGGFYSLILSDGTRVWLNSESELEYPVLFGKGVRLVKLTGEAFFEVNPDASRPFIVEAGDIRTKVLGTSFNIKAYNNESDISTTLFTGKVDVTFLTDTANRVILSPGKQADWDIQTHQLKVHEVNLDHIIAWKKGEFVFNKENIEVVTRQIERWYGVKFIYEIANREEYTFNGYFSKDETLEAILNVFTLTGGPKFKIEEDIVYVRDK